MRTLDRGRRAFLRAQALLSAGALLRPEGVLAAPADARVLRTEFAIAETSFDPAFASDAASDGVIANIMEAMLDYDFLVRPVKLVPRTLEALPTVDDGGRTYTCRLRKGIHFTPDPAFKGQRRELVAADYAYALKRILDPAVRSPWLWLLDHKLVGGDDARAAAQRNGRFDYDAPLPGLEVVDRYTLRIRLVAPDLRFPYVIAVQNTAAVAREVVEHYGADLGAHPVGTGPYKLGVYQRSSRIELVANPDFRETTYVPAGPVPPEFAQVAAALKGKRLPRTPRVDIRIIEEGQSAWLAFVNRELDLLEILPSEMVQQALAGGRLKPELAARGIVHRELLRPTVSFVYFNMEDPLVGGYTPEKIALRRAVSMGFDTGEFVRVLYNGRAHPANGPIPPDIAGYDPALHTDAQVYDPAAARALLDRYGYRDRNGDGYREQPDGSPLVLTRWSTPNSIARQTDELWRKNMQAIGIAMDFRSERITELRKMARNGKIPMRGDGWNADYPDAENFMQLLYGGAVGQANYARFNLPAFNELYEKARTLPDSPARTALFSQMTRLVISYAPWKLLVNDIEDTLAHPWARNFVPHPIRSQVWMYVDVDPDARAAAR
ncbi:MAG: heme-binding protein [Proteobacteria bacterium]|nr:heme-binding protein [Pseudomonadota bacterium]